MFQSSYSTPYWLAAVTRDKTILLMRYSRTVSSVSTTLLTRRDASITLRTIHLDEMNLSTIEGFHLFVLSRLGKDHSLLLRRVPPWSNEWVKDSVEQFMLLSRLTRFKSVLFALWICSQARELFRLCASRPTSSMRNASTTSLITTRTNPNFYFARYAEPQLNRTS